MLTLLSFLVVVLLTLAGLAWLFAAVAPAYRPRPGQELDLLFSSEMHLAWTARTGRSTLRPVVGEEFEATVTLSPASDQRSDRVVTLALQGTSQLQGATVVAVAAGCDVSPSEGTSVALHVSEDAYARFLITPRQPGRTQVRFELWLGPRLLAAFSDGVDVRVRKAGIALPRWLAIAGGALIATIGWIHLLISLGRDAIAIIAAW